MLRLLHLADVHLGARHPELGAAAAVQRERQFGAFATALALAVTEKVDLVLIAGDLFDSNTQPRRTVERVAAELRVLIAAGCRAILIPGLHDVYDATSIYRTYDLPDLAGIPPDSDALVVLTPDRPSVAYPSLNIVLHGRVVSSARVARSPIAGFVAAPDRRAAWRVGLAHGALRSEAAPGEETGALTEEEIAGTGLDYLALGHVHRYHQGASGGTTWAYPGAPDLVDVEHDGLGQVVLVELREVDGAHQVRVQPRSIGRTRYLRLELDAANLAGQDALAAQLEALADGDVVCHVRLTGLRPEELVIDEDELARRVSGLFLHYRFEDLSVPPLPSGPLPPADTIAGAFMRDVGARIASAETGGHEGETREAREMLWLGQRVLLGRTSGPEPRP